MAGLSSFQRGLVRGPVGNNLRNEPDDVIGVKKALRSLRRFEDEEENPHGYGDSGN